MLLKDILELAVSFQFTEDSIQFLDCKISEHRALLREVFPNFKLRPKHHHIEHYPQLMRMYGPLRNVWTIRFEGKHKFFKKVIRDAQNFKKCPLNTGKQASKDDSLSHGCQLIFQAEGPNEQGQQFTHHIIP